MSNAQKFENAIKNDENPDNITKTTGFPVWLIVIIAIIIIILLLSMIFLACVIC